MFAFGYTFVCDVCTWYMCLRVHAHMCARRYGGPRLVASVFLHLFPPYIPRQTLSLNTELTMIADVAACLAWKIPSLSLSCLLGL